MGIYEKSSLLILGLLVLCSSFFGINSGPLWSCLEAANGGVIREMISSGDFLTLRILDEPAFQLAPLYYWLSSGLYYLLGDGAFSARFWSPVASSATVMIIYLGVTNLLNEAAGFCSALVLISSLQFVLFSKMAVVDNLFLLFLTWTIFSYIYRNYWSMYVGWALCVWTAGSLGLLLPGLIIFVHGLLFAKAKVWQAMPKLKGVLLVLLLCAPWYGLMYYYHGQEAVLTALQSFYFDSIVDYPYAHSGVEHYFLALVLGFFPWLGFLLLSLKHAAYDSRIDDLQKLGPLLCWLVLGLVVLSYHGLKSPVATTLLLPPLASLVGWNLARLREKQGHNTKYHTWMLLSGLTFALGAVLCYYGGSHLGGELFFVGEISAALLLIIGLAVIYTLGSFRDVFLATWLHALSGLFLGFVLFVFALPLLVDDQNVARLSAWYRQHCPFSAELYVDKDLRQGFYHYAGRAGHALPQGAELQQLLGNGQLKYFLVDEEGLKLLPQKVKVVQQVGDNYLVEQQ